MTRIAEVLPISSSPEVVLMTSEEWRVQGIEFALSAEADRAVEFLQKAVKCFTLAGDQQLTQLATAQCKTVELALRLRLRDTNGRMSSELEREAAAVVLEGLQCGVFHEVKVLCETVRGAVQYPEIFARHVMIGLRR